MGSDAGGGAMFDPDMFAAADRVKKQALIRYVLVFNAYDPCSVMGVPY